VPQPTTLPRDPPSYRVPLKNLIVTELVKRDTDEHITSIFVVEESKTETSVKRVETDLPWFLLGLFCDSEYGGMFLRNFGSLSTDYTSPHPKR
jgi:hypothetical protein